MACKKFLDGKDEIFGLAQANTIRSSGSASLLSTERCRFGAGSLDSFTLRVWTFGSFRGEGETQLSSPETVWWLPVGAEDRIVQPLQATHQSRTLARGAVRASYAQPEPEYKQTLLPTLEQVARTWARRPEQK